jgi:hypothetical protein
MDASDVAVKYVRWNGWDWEVHTVATLTYYTNYNAALALSGDGHAHIAYMSNPTILAVHAEWDGAEWQRTNLHRGHLGYAASFRPYNDLALKPNGDPCMSAWTRTDDGQDRITVLCRTGTGLLGWEAIFGVLWNPGHLDDHAMARAHSLAVSSEGDARVSFPRAVGQGFGLWYTAAGHTVGVQVDGEAARVGFYPSLALEGLGHPHISYYDHTNGNLKYARWSGSEWIIETVDSAGDVGRYTSLALDGTGNAHISYYDVSNSNLKYAVWDGSQWHIETVDSSGAVGEWSSLALDDAGHVHISYYDHTNGKLKYATNSGAFGH